MNPDIPGLGDPAPKARSPRIGFIIITVVVTVLIAMIVVPGTKDPKTKGYLTQMKLDLVSVRTVQEWAHDSTGKYVRSVGPPFESTPGVNPPTLTATDSTWSATVTSTRFPGAMCGIAVGVANPVDRRAKDGEPVCAIPPAGSGAGR